MTPETDTAKGAARSDGSGVGVQLVALRRSFGPTVAFDDIVDLDNKPRQLHYCRAGAGAIHRRPTPDATGI